MSKTIKGFVAGILMTIMVTATLVYANPGGVMREVFYGVNIVVNGGLQNFPDDMTPFISGGRTFLPVRGISEALGVPVEWYGPTQTVYIGTIPQGAPFWTTTPPFQRSGSGSMRVITETVHMLGQPYTNAITVNNLSLGTDWSDHALNGQYNTFTGTLGRVDGARLNPPGVVSFIGDGRELATFSVDGNTMPHEISVDVTGVLVLRIQIQIQTSFGTGGARPAIANAMIQ